MMMERGDFHVFHEPFSATYYYSPRRRSKRYAHLPPDPEHDFDAVKKRILRKAEQKPVFFKDMASHVIHFADRGFVSRIRNTFLIRDPERALPSFHHKWPDFTDEEAGFEPLYELFRMAHETSENTPPLVKASDVIENPGDTIKAYCDAVDIEFMPESLEWDPASPPQWETWKGWHDDAEKSSGFEKPKKKNYARIRDSRRLTDAYQHCLPFYEKLLKHRLKVG